MHNKNLKNSKDTPVIIIIMGITGDLADRKIIPALWHLFTHNYLPRKTVIIGIARRKLSSQDIQNIVKDSLKKQNDFDKQSKLLAKFVSMFTYISGNFENIDAFNTLKIIINKNEKKWKKSSNKIFYLAVPPTHYQHIFQNIAEVGLNKETNSWSRLLIEKPFGTDLQSSTKLQSLLLQYFVEEQIYRIDHYLFKEIIQGIENIRFSNNLFDRIWENTAIDRIDIRLNESIGVEERGEFYDSIGALRDIGQNHVLSMLASITMDYPELTTSNSVRENRTKVLKTLKPWSRNSIRENTYRAQYLRYSEISGVTKASQTETYFAVQTELLHPKWKGVPIYMEGGKRLSATNKEIIVTLKHPKICHLCRIGKHDPNRIIFRLDPNDEIIIEFSAKKPGLEHILERRTFSFFLYEKETKNQYVEEYAKVLYSALHSNQSLFASAAEIEVMWNFADPILKGWKENITPLQNYKQETTPNYFK